MADAWQAMLLVGVVGMWIAYLVISHCSDEAD